MRQIFLAFMALVIKDLYLVKAHTSSAFWLAVSIVGLVAISVIVPLGTTAHFLGEDYVRLLIFSLAGIGSFFEYYSKSLSEDKRDGTLTLVVLGDIPAPLYFVAKAIVPLLVALLVSLLTFLGFFVCVGASQAIQFEVSVILAMIAAELYLSMSLGMLYSLALKHSYLDKGPAFLYLVTGVNALLVYFFNPVTSFFMFAISCVVIGTIIFVIAGFLFPRVFKNNLSELKSECERFSSERI